MPEDSTRCSRTRSIRRTNTVSSEFGYRFSVGDKVMQIENNYDRDVYNGDIGYVTNIDDEEQELTATFDEHIVNVRIRRTR